MKQMTVQIKKEEPALLKYIRNRVMKQNKNFVMVFVGATGSGKSYAALRLAEMLDKTFDINRVAFHTIDFMQIVNKLIEDGKNGEDIRGKVILWDETGVEHSAREFMTKSNRVMNYFFQTSRHHNLIVLMTVPLLSFIDSATRKLVHAVSEMCSIDASNRKSILKVKMIQTNVMSGKEYPKYLRYNIDGKRLVSKKISLGLPGLRLRNRYEKIKNDYTTGLNKEIMNKLIAQKIKEQEALKQKPKPPLTDLQKKIMDCLKKGITNKKEIAAIVGKHVQQIFDNFRYMRNKGYYIGKNGELEE